MIKQLPLRLQVAFFLALVVSGAVLYAARQHVSDAAAGLSDAKKSKRAQRRSERSVPVIVARSRAAENDKTVTAVGTSRARRSVMLRAKSDGVIVAFKVRAGNRVKKDDIVAELDAAKAELAVQIAQKKHELALRLFTRSKRLQQRNINSGARVLDAQALAERTELEVRHAREALRDSKIVAPFDGIVGLPKVEVGDRVTTAIPIISLDDRAELLVEFDVPEKYAARIDIGDDVKAVTPSHANRRFQGRIEHIDSRIDPSSRTVKVRSVIPNRRDVLRPGMSFNIELHLPGATFTAVPELSLQWRKGESYVWVVRGNRVNRVLVTAIRRLNSIVLVDGKISRGDLIVVEGVQRLRPGRKVQYSLPDAPSRPAQEPARSSVLPGGDKG